jgi:hypothetical protein
MKHTILIISIIIFLISCNKNVEISQDNNLIPKEPEENEYTIIDGIPIDDSKFGTYYKDIQIGLLVHEENPGSYWDNFVERLFVNPVSRREIYYSGEFYRGTGTFWIKENNKKINILETDIVYGPMVKWHGDNIAEIFRPSGNPFWESYFYDFENWKISQRYDFPLYFDLTNKVILIWGYSDFELYDLETDEIIREYDFRQNNNMTAAWPYINYYFEKENEETLSLFYDDWVEKRKGKFIMDISKAR